MVATHSWFLFLDGEEISNCFTHDFISDCSFNDSLIKYSNYLVDNYKENNSYYLLSLSSHIIGKFNESNEYMCNFFILYLKISFIIEHYLSNHGLLYTSKMFKTNVYNPLRSVNEYKTPRKIRWPNVHIIKN